VEWKRYLFSIRMIRMMKMKTMEMVAMGEGQLSQEKGN